MEFDQIFETIKSILPYYEREDKDDFLYIATNHDISLLAQRIHDMSTSTDAFKRMYDAIVDRLENDIKIGKINLPRK